MGNIGIGRKIEGDSTKLNQKARTRKKESVKEKAKQMRRRVGERKQNLRHGSRSKIRQESETLCAPVYVYVMFTIHWRNNKNNQKIKKQNIEQENRENSDEERKTFD